MSSFIKPNSWKIKYWSWKKTPGGENLRPPDAPVFREAGILHPHSRHPGSPPPRAGFRPDSRPQVTRFSISRAVLPPASQPPCRPKRRHSEPLSRPLSEAARRNFRLPDFLGASFVWRRNSEKPNRVMFGIKFGGKILRCFMFGSGSGSSSLVRELSASETWPLVECDGTDG